MITIFRSTTSSDSTSTGFYHAEDTFTNPYGNPDFCHQRNSQCIHKNIALDDCHKCACAIDDTLYSIKHGCLGSSEVRALTNGKQKITRSHFSDLHNSVHGTTEANNPFLCEFISLYPSINAKLSLD